jgi:hypothetical protein
LPDAAGRGGGNHRRRQREKVPAIHQP